MCQFTYISNILFVKLKKTVYNRGNMDLRFIYLIAVFLSLIELIIYYETATSGTNKNFIILYIATFVSNFGTAFANYAPNLEACLFGIMISYIGSICIMSFMLVVVVELCKIKFPLALRILLFGSAFFFIFTICTTQELALFYTDLSISKINGLTILNHSSGPVQLYYLIFLSLIDVASIVIVLLTFKNKKQVSRSTLKILLSMLVFGTLTYIITFIIKFRYNVMVFVYVVMQAMFIVLSIHINMYDLSQNLMNVFKNRGGYGYIAFDTKKRLLGCDELAMKMFPCLKDAAIDSTLKEECHDLIRKLDYSEEREDWSQKLESDFEIFGQGISAICTLHKIQNQGKTIGYLFELRDNTKQRNYINGINMDNRVLAQAVAEKTAKLSAMQDSIIKGMAMMVESRDNSTGGHILRTSDCIRIFANRLKSEPGFGQYNTSFWENLIKAAPMHDLGKIAVDDSILRKPGKFEPDEYEMMKTHSTKGAVIVREVLRETTDSDFKEIAVNVAHYHHEKWNGKGYPTGKKGEDIPIEARIMALADVFDALVSRRCYKEAKSFDEAFSIIESDLGIHFDPIVGKVFLECRPQLEEYYNNAFKTDTFFSLMDL